MHILFVNHSHLSSNSGIHIFNIANHLMQLGVQCSVCIPNKKNMDYAGKALFDVMTFEDARKNRDHRTVDLIHCWTPREVVRRMTEELAQVYNCPYIVHLEDNEEALLEASMELPFFHLSCLPLAHLDKVIPPHLSHPIRYKEFLRKASGVSILIDQLNQFIPAGIPGQEIWPGYEDDMDWMTSDNGLRKKLGIKLNEYVIVYTGNVHSANWHEVSSLYLAVGLLNRRGYATKIVRTGNDYVPLFDKPMLEILKHHVINLGYVARNELPAILSLADVLVQPGKADKFNNYRFPSKLPEYLATGKPVLLPAANIGRYLKDGEECILLKDGHALEISQRLEELFQNKSLGERIGIGGARFARQNLRWNQCALKLHSFYQSVLTSNSLQSDVSPLETENHSLTSVDEMIPPEERIFVGGGDFTTVGEGFKKHFIELGHLQPNAKVLDVGCGIGRMAVPLTQYLTPQAEYWGFDIVKDGIDWCTEKITPRFPNFRFLLSDVYNKQYNQNGSLKASQYKFPFADDFFDFVFLTSVFTHMLPADLEHYLSEIARVMKPGGKCLITYFLLNPESINLIEQGLTSQKFQYEIENCLTVYQDNPEYALAYPQTIIKDLYKKYNLQIIEPVHYGSWCQREEFLSYQDIIVAEKISKKINMPQSRGMVQMEPQDKTDLLNYATVRDYCDSADRFPQVLKLDGDLKDVQRPWMIKSIIENLPVGSKLLEIGGGEPVAADALQRLGYEVTIVDPYDGSGNGPHIYGNYVKNYPGVKIIKSYFDENTPLQLQAYDCIFSISVLEHVPHLKLKDVFSGISKFLKPGGCSIHCTDLVIAGEWSDWHDQGAREILFLQNHLQNPHLDEKTGRLRIDEMFDVFYRNIEQDVETYYHSAQGHNLWRGKMPYDSFPFRKIVSMQTTVVKTL